MGRRHSVRLILPPPPAPSGRSPLQCATAAAALSWMLTEWLFKGKPTVMGLISGAVAGLVVITPACGFVNMTGSMCMGFLGGILCLLSVQAGPQSARPAGGGGGGGGDDQEGGRRV